MIIQVIAPIKEIHGKMPGKNSMLHARTNKYGTIFLARNSKSNQPPTEKQIAQREKMRKAIAAYQLICADPELRKVWEKRLAGQTKCKTLRGLITKHYLLTT